LRVPFARQTASPFETVAQQPFADGHSLLVVHFSSHDLFPPSSVKHVEPASQQTPLHLGAPPEQVAPEPWVPPLAAEAGEGISIVQATVEGTVLLTQTCDIVRSCLRRPFIEVAPLVRVEEGFAHEVERGYWPRYASISALRTQRLVADLDRVMTVEKSIVAVWTRTPGHTSDEDARRFAQALGRKRVRFAFPDDFNDLVKKLQSRIETKHDKGADEGRALRSLREVRVTASPSWDGPGNVGLFFWFVRNEAATTFEGKSWDGLLSAWMNLVPAKERFSRVEGAVVSLQDMTAAEHVESDPLDLDHLSTRGP
jgi:hypothetical protein